ncbi:MAG TPA: aldehyde ferredoxin oxidoreductase, partial [Proteobacteria bacterium]|nr:aldehyde ferredoxin oxidoreductase [Pseudomonadota bacterium]
SDYESIVEMNRLCNDYGLDTISVGATLACMAEIEGRRIPPHKLVELTKLVCENEGVGAELALCAKRFAELRGKPDAAMHVKGLELPGYDPRGVKGMALGYGTSNRGGCHLRAYMVSPEILRKPKAIDRSSLDGKAGYLFVFQNRFAYVDSLVLCKFLFFAVSDDEVSKLAAAATGVEFTAEELMKIGERIWNLERLYNIACGFTRSDDFLPRRFYTEASTESPVGQPINRDEYSRALTEYYTCRGWDEQGVPTDGKLKELGIEPKRSRSAA